MNKGWIEIPPKQVATEINIAMRYFPFTSIFSNLVTDVVAVGFRMADT